MTNAFADLEPAPSQSPTTVGEDDEMPTEMLTDTEAFADAVRSTMPDTDGINDTKRYSDPDGDSEADDVDPRGLFRKPELNEIRYYAREGPYGEAIVRKPIEDAFKYGFDIDGDNTEGDDGVGKIEAFLDEYKHTYKFAEKKARRDGVAVIMHQIADEASSAADPIPPSGGSFEGFTVWTVDNLSDELAESTVAQHTEYDRDSIYVSQGAVNGGIAIVDDISHPDHGEVVGYGVEPRQDSEDVQQVEFVHGDRCQHLVWGEWVDGALGNNLTGEHIGESVLTSVLEPLKASQMGFWAMKNILFRYSAPLHAIEPPESWGKDEWDDFTEDLDNISASSDATLPPGASLTVAEAVSEFDPEPIYEVLVESICAGTVFSKPVLQGTQTGTVSGSETDIKTYFNEISLLRTERIEPKFRETVKKVSNYDQSTIPRVAGVDTFDIDWGPLFKPTDIEMASGMVDIVTATTNGIKNYVLTPDEARSIVAEEWAEFDTDIELEELSEDEWDDLDRINMNEAGQGIHDNEDVNEERARENPNLKNGGGQPAGQTRESSQPTRDSLDEEQLDAIADKVVERLTE